MVPEKHLAVVLATKLTKGEPTTSNKAPVDKDIPGGGATTPRDRPSLAGVGGDNETSRKTPDPKSMVPKTLLAAVLETKTTGATSETVSTPTVGDTIKAAEDTATANALEDDDDALHSQCLQLERGSESCSDQGCDVTGHCTGPLPRAVSGGSRCCRLMVTVSQEPWPRARDLEAKKDREHERANLDFNERYFEPGRRADLHPGLLPDGSSKHSIELLQSSQTSGFGVQKILKKSEIQANSAWTSGTRTSSN